jgi:sulfite reductase beta subunit-like hemoprotein
MMQHKAPTYQFMIAIDVPHVNLGMAQSKLVDELAGDYMLEHLQDQPP